MTEAGRGYYRHEIRLEGHGSENTSDNTPENTPELSKPDVARAMGFTGNLCSNCGGIHLQQAGHCEVCSDCGTTTGCS